MARTIGIGVQGYEKVRKKGYFYVDKTSFVRDWWLSGADITLICRPRRFGKSLNLDTVRYFLSTEFAGRGEEFFGGLEVWGDPDMRALQGTVPVIWLSFADIKTDTFPEMKATVKQVLVEAVLSHDYLYDSPALRASDRTFLSRVSDDMDDVTAVRCLKRLCLMLRRHWKTRPVVLLDEYDTPMEQAWTCGFWDETSSFMRRLMNSTFKTNPDLDRGLITGITRVSRESIFSDLNNLQVVTTSSNRYQTSFGFTQAEVDAALAEYGLGDLAGEVSDYYDGFTFGGEGGVYNPWSITKLLDSGGVLEAYWSNTSGNNLVSEIVRRGDRQLKADLEELMRGGTIRKVIDEQVVFSELETKPNAVWALLLAAGYVTSPGPAPKRPGKEKRPLKLTNYEVELTFDDMVVGWFSNALEDYNEFTRAILAGDAQLATRCLADVTVACVSSFDSGTRPSEKSEPERFYHGLVLGLLASLRGRYSVESNKESGFGRYDVALVPTSGAVGTDPAVVMEFKVFDPASEETLNDTVSRARQQIEGRAYVAGLIERGISRERIRTFGIAFRGKEVLVG